ncbi:MAG: ABC transporter permease [Actinomycetota bacterium]
MSETPPPTVTVNRPPSGIELPDVGALWRDRELFYFLAWRDVRVRYKQTALGAAWAVLQPVITMLIFTFVFGRVAGLAPEGVPYSIFVYTALVPWTFFSTAITQAAQSLVLQERILTRVHFPRILIPMAAIAAVLVDLAVTLPVLGVLLVVHGIAPGWAIVTLPLFVLLVVLAASAVGLWLGAINVRYRDVRYVTPFLVQLWFFITPIVYSADVVPSRWRILLELNPLVAVVDGFRWAVLDADAPGRSLIVAVVVVAVGLTAALFHFRRLEATFADEV